MPTAFTTPGARTLFAAACTALSLMVSGCDSSDRPTNAPPGPEDRAMDAREQALERKQLQQVPQDQPEPVVGEVPERVMTDVKGHLAARVSADPGSIEVVRAEAHEWPSGAMGCPQPGLTYTQSPVQGYWIVLRHNGRDYDYRVSRSGTLVLCEGMMLDAPPMR